MGNTFTIAEIQRATVAVTFYPSAATRHTAPMFQGLLARVNGHVILFVSELIVQTVQCCPDCPELSARPIVPLVPDLTVEVPLRAPYAHGAGEAQGLLAFDLSAVDPKSAGLAAIRLTTEGADLPDDSCIVIPFDPFKALGLEHAHYVASGSGFDVGLPVLSEIAGKAHVATVVGVALPRRGVAPVPDLLQMALCAIDAGRKNRRGLLRYCTPAARSKPDRQ